MPKAKRDWTYVGPREAAKHPWYTYDIAVFLAALVVLANLVYSASFVLYCHLPFQFGIETYQLFRAWDDMLSLKADFRTVHLIADYLAILACFWALFLIDEKSPRFLGGSEAVLLFLVFVRTLEVVMIDQAGNEPVLHSLAWFMGGLAVFLLITAVLETSPFVRVTFLKQVPSDVPFDA